LTSVATAASPYGKIVIRRGGGTMYYEKAEVSTVQQILRPVLRRQNAHAAKQDRRSP
jgi:hypothetical protein